MTSDFAVHHGFGGFHTAATITEERQYHDNGNPKCPTVAGGITFLWGQNALAQSPQRCVGTWFI